jgi:hypothetical protein
MARGAYCFLQTGKCTLPLALCPIPVRDSRLGSAQQQSRRHAVVLLPSLSIPLFFGLFFGFRFGGWSRLRLLSLVRSLRLDRRGVAGVGNSCALAAFAKTGNVLNTKKCTALKIRNDFILSLKSAVHSRLTARLTGDSLTVSAASARSSVSAFAPEASSPAP